MAVQPYFAVIVKKNATEFLKLRKVTRFDKLYRWLDVHYPDWRWGNVYYRRQQIGNFTKNKRPPKFFV